MYADGRAREVRKSRRHEGAGQFDLSLPPDVVKDHIVAIANAAHRLVGAIHPHQWLQRFIFLASAVSRPYGLGYGILL
jgi:hypothetical protein